MTENESVVVIKVVGVGGAGNNAVNRMVEAEISGVEFISANTDKPALIKSNADKKIQLGIKLTGGQGAGADPEVGRKAAEENRNDIAKELEDADMIFIACGMGGGTGTGAAPVVADIAREAGKLTIAVVTTPFSFEGSKRMQQAVAGIEELHDKVDALFIIPNERLKEVTDQKITFLNAFKIADDVLYQAVLNISSIVRNTEAINLDFADICRIMKSSGLAHMGTAVATGKEKAATAAVAAMSSALMQTSIDGAKGIIINVIGGVDLTLEEIELAANMISERAHPDANIIFGAGFDESLEDSIKITVIATHFSEEQQNAFCVTQKPTLPAQPQRAVRPVQDAAPVRREETSPSGTGEQTSMSDWLGKAKRDEAQPGRVVTETANTAPVSAAPRASAPERDQRAAQIKSALEPKAMQNNDADDESEYDKILKMFNLGR
ncbi:MAG: cell division protein FtsZ [Oscillospiraceae bacterium]|jgi:cell division protein FtsZ|nr:cell division protein FtsZ [Oscillospiraceae bacterium]